jgi:hypothetical protein
MNSGGSSASKSSCHGGTSAGASAASVPALRIFGAAGVADVEREVAELKARGVAFEIRRSRHEDGERHLHRGAKAAWFKDRDGNIMAVIQDAR